MFDINEWVLFIFSICCGVTVVAIVSVDGSCYKKSAIASIRWQFTTYKELRDPLYNVGDIAHRGGDLGGTGGTVPPKIWGGGTAHALAPQYLEK